jgi:hypothetical protein
MADGTTTNFGFALPEVGGSTDTWGDKINGNWTALDTLLKTTFAALAFAAPKVLDDATPLAPDAKDSWNFEIKLPASRTMQEILNAQAGMSGQIFVSRTVASAVLTLPATWKNIGTTKTQSTAANSRDLISYYKHRVASSDGTVTDLTVYVLNPVPA